MSRLASLGCPYRSKSAELRRESLLLLYDTKTALDPSIDLKSASASFLSPRRFDLIAVSIVALGAHSEDIHDRATDQKALALDLTGLVGPHDRVSVQAGERLISFSSIVLLFAMRGLPSHSAGLCLIKR